jgi:four helix bundle protein
MPTYQRFEDLPVWQTAATLFERCDDFLAQAPARLRAAFHDQLERVVLSVSNNIAEGFERGTTSELLSFLYIARGSAGEVRSMLTLLLRRPWMHEHKPEIAALIELAESCSRQLRAWAESLQNSEITGSRHLNEQSRKNWKKRTMQQEGQQRLHELQRAQIASLPPEHPLRRQWEHMHGPLE